MVSTFPSEYIYDPNTVAEIARVLRPGGRLIVIEAANLLPVGFFQPVLLLLQALVYGPASVFRPRKKQQPQPARNVVPTDRQTGTGLTTEVLENAWFGRHIPLEQHKLLRRSEIVRSLRWEIYITLGEKA